MLQNLLHQTIRIGRLIVHTPDGQTIKAGPKSVGPGQPYVVVRLKGAWTALKLVVNPDFYLGEAYMNGELVLERGSLWDLLDLLGRNLALRPAGSQNPLARLWKAAGRQLQQTNSLSVARRNVAHHYDLSDALYRTFLDENMQYSCAYFREPGQSLEEAQRAKIRHLISKLRLEPGHRVLDIGCGWGGLALEMARAEGVCVTGVTLSEEQLRICKERSSRLGLDHKIVFAKSDYREIAGRYDRIISVGMFEHVGAPNYLSFFRRVSDMLSDDGVALIHSIGRRTPPSLTNPWIRKYIFPGGYIPALSEVTAAIEQTGLWITDVEILRLHYAETLRYWRERVLKNASLISDLYDDRFVRMWEFYLAGCEMGFRHSDLMVFQAQLAKRVDSIPVTRDYMGAEEDRLTAEAAGA